MSSTPLATTKKDQPAQDHHYKTVAQMDPREIKDISKTGNPNLDEDGVHKRSCTDIPCSLVFLAFLGFMVYINIYAMSKGDLGRLTHGFDAAGQLCGIDAAVKDKPLLYYCPLAGGALNNMIPLAINPNAPTCVAACPSGNETDPCSANSSTLSLTGSPPVSYPTSEILGLYCLPDMAEIAALAAATNATVPYGLRSSLTGTSGPIGGTFEKFTKDVGGLKRCYMLLIGSTVFAFILGFVYFCILKECARPLVYFSMLLIIFLFGSIAAFFLIGEVAFARPAPIQTVVAGTTIAPGNVTTVALTTTLAPATTVAAAVTTTVAAAQASIGGLPGRRLEAESRELIANFTAVAANAGAAFNSTVASANAAYAQAQAALDQRWKEFGGRQSWERYNPYYNEHMTPSDARTCSLVTGAVFGVLAFVVLCILCCAHESIDVAVKVVQVAVKCLFDGPSLLLVPFWDALFKTIAFFALFYHFVLLVSCGTITKNTSSLVAGGQSRHYSCTQEQLMYMAYYLFGIFWVLEFLTAVGQFSLSYAVVNWYFTPKDQKSGNKSGFNGCTSWLKGICFGTTFHIGTLALGSFLVALVRFVRFILFLLKQASKGKAGGSLVQCVVCIIDCCCMCIQKCIEQINKNAYIDVAINSTWFCTAAKHVFEFIGQEANPLFILHGACFIFTVAGVGCISMSTGYLTYVVCTSHARWTDDTSPHHVNSPRLVAFVAGLIGVFIGYAFMAVFDHTADTLLYVFDWNKHHGHNTADEYAPKELLDLVNYKKLDAPAKEEKPPAKKCAIQ